MDIPRFTSINDGKVWWRIKGKGWVCKVACDRERDRNNTGLIGSRVEIDGELFLCVGIEMFMSAVPIWKGEEIGLVVREINNNTQ